MMMESSVILVLFLACALAFEVIVVRRGDYVLAAIWLAITAFGAYAILRGPSTLRYWISMGLLALAALWTFYRRHGRSRA